MKLFSEFDPTGELYPELTEAETGVPQESDPLFKDTAKEELLPNELLSSGFEAGIPYESDPLFELEEEEDWELNPELLTGAEAGEP